MKKFLKISTIAILATTSLALTPVGASEEIKLLTATEIVALDASLAGRVVQAEVNGMVCDFCAQSLTKVLKKNKSVEDVQISLETKLVTIIVMDGGTVTDEEVSKAINWAGYDLVKIVRA